MVRPRIEGHRHCRCRRRHVLPVCLGDCSVLVHSRSPDAPASRRYRSRTGPPGQGVSTGRLDAGDRPRELNVRARANTAHHSGCARRSPLRPGVAPTTLHRRRVAATAPTSMQLGGVPAYVPSPITFNGSRRAQPPAVRHRSVPRFALHVNRLGRSHRSSKPGRHRFWRAIVAAASYIPHSVAAGFVLILASRALSAARCFAAACPEASRCLRCSASCPGAPPRRPRRNAMRPRVRRSAKPRWLRVTA